MLQACIKCCEHVLIDASMSYVIKTLITDLGLYVLPLILWVIKFEAIYYILRNYA